MTQAATTASQVPSRPAADDLRHVILRQTREVVALKEKFFTDEADRIVDCCQAMAARSTRVASCWSWATAEAAATRCTW